MKRLHSKLKSFNKDVNKRANDFKRKLAQIIAWRLIENTPVDTSKALSNWVAGLSNPKRGERSAYYVGMSGSTASQSSSMAFSLASTIIGRAKVGEIIYISNNVDYIHLLNQGYSRQAPSGFIEDEVAVAVASMKRTKL